MFGPNGSGKTTILNLLAGLTRPDSGTILIDGKAPFPGHAAYVFQNFKDSLFPWRTVEGNLLFPLECGSSAPSERRKQLLDFVEAFEFNIPLTSRVYELSIGQQQMVSLARALITRPRFLVMDEPFSALDFRARRAMQERLLSYWKESGATILLVSHEIDEAIYLGQRVIVLPPRPANTVREITIPLPFPRRREMLFTQDYFQLRSEALRFFEEHAKSDA
jgi:NitT/TauT family transport system ATP-binding protein